MYEELQHMAPKEMSCNYSILNLQSCGSAPHIDKLDVVDVEVYWQMMMNACPYIPIFTHCPRDTFSLGRLGWGRQFIHMLNAREEITTHAGYEHTWINGN